MHAAQHARRPFAQQARGLFQRWRLPQQAGLYAIGRYRYKPQAASQQQPYASCHQGQSRQTEAVSHEAVQFQGGG